MRLPDKMTYGESMDPAMKIETQEEADEYFEALVERHMRITGESRERAEYVNRTNLGYWTGYCDAETAARVFRLFKCRHPFFGTSRPSFTEAFETGKKLAGERV